MTDDRIFAAADKLFPSLDALNAWFAAQIHGTDDRAEKAELRFARQTAIARHVQRAAAAANAPIPGPPPPPLPPPEPLPADATDDDRAARLYGPRLSGSRPLPEAVTPQVSPAATSEAVPVPQASGSDSTPPLPVGESRQSLARKADDEAAAKLYGTTPIGVGFAPVHTKPQHPPPIESEPSAGAEEPPGASE